MANFDQLKQSVSALIRTNGAEEITGQIMQDVLMTIINSISGGYMFGGVAQHSGNVGNPDYNVFYLAGSGAYTGYGAAINIPDGCYGVFRYNGSWTQDVVDIGVHLTGTISAGETNGVTGDVINTALQQLFNNVMNILDTLTFTYNTPSAQQATKAMLDVIVTPTGGASHVLTTLTLVSATAAAAGLMSAEDKRKVDRMLTDFRSLSFSDTTAVADQATKIVQTLSATLGENPEAITTMTFLAATASKAGLMSAADKAKLDALWSSGYQFVGIATPSTTPISTTSKIFYIATEAGTYFNAVTVTQGINILSWDGTAWSAVQVIGIDDEPTAGSDNLVESGGVAKFTKGVEIENTTLSWNAGQNENKYVCTNKIAPGDLLYIEVSSAYDFSVPLEISYLNEDGNYEGIKVISSNYAGFINVPNNLSSSTKRLIFSRYGGEAFSNTVKVNKFNESTFTEGIKKSVQETFASEIAAKGVSGFTLYSPTNMEAMSMLRKIEFYCPDSDEEAKVIRFGYYDNGSPRVQITISYQNVNYDFVFEDDHLSTPHVRDYMKKVKNLYLHVIIDWSYYIRQLSSVSFFVPNLYFGSDFSISSLTNYGKNWSYEYTTEQNIPHSILCPCKRVVKAGKVAYIKLRSNIAGDAIIYVGDIDQNYLFVSRAAYTVHIEAGLNEYDITDKGIYVQEGERVAIRIPGHRYFRQHVGLPEDDLSFYYNSTTDPNNFQLEYYGIADRRIQFDFSYTVEASDELALEAGIAANKTLIDSLYEQIAVVQSNMNVVTDSSGNRYKLKVVNGDVVPVALTIRNVIVVGNSITIHPTYTDTEPDYHTNIWWGHWSMAATCKDVSWPKLLENILKERNAESSVTPVFGRRYELTNATPTTPDTFTYWDEGQWKDLSANIGSFSNTDCIIFYLGHNYSGNDWETKYQAMIDQFKTWFPSAWIICVAAYASKTAVNNAIQNVATREGCEYVTPISMKGNKIGAYVSDDEGTLHQIGNTAVAGHPGDYGEYIILDRMCRTSTLSLTNNTTLYSVNLESEGGVTLSTVTSQVLYKSIVSVFVTVSNDAEFEGLVVEDDGGNTISVTDQGNTAYGRVFTFEMPADNVTVSVS